jgi:cobalt-zinc-cadmium efflux system membrane fusion protein
MTFTASLRGIAPRTKRQLLIGCTVAIIALIALGIGARWLPAWFGRSPVSDVARDDAAVRQQGETIVRLPPEKLAAAEIEIGRVQEREVAEFRTVPGKLEYDRGKHLELKSPVAGVLSSVLVSPGQHVEAGAKLCVLNSSEIGLARDEVQGNESELEIAKKESALRKEVAENVATLLEQLDDQPGFAKIEAYFAQRRLGEYRESIFGAYSKLKLAEAVINQTAGLDGQGVISGRVREERQSAREVAAAAFQTACEQAQFSAQQERDRAANKVAHQQRLLQISQKNLAALLGPFADQTPLSDQDDLSEFTLCAPFTATVDERHVAMAERVIVGQSLFVLADTRTLWISAEIHERDWKLVRIEVGQDLTVTSPALPGKTFMAKMDHLGASVSPETRAVSLVAQLDNPDGQFRPGMFAWVTIPYQTARRRLVVPAAAVVRQDERPMVFVPESERSFRRVDVQVGLETPEWIEIESGLAAGQKVVTNGAFALKSELLLEREE